MTKQQDKAARVALGARIRRARDDKGLSRKGLARLAGISLSTLQRWEEGENEPRALGLARIAERLGTSSDALRGAEINEAVISQLPKGVASEVHELAARIVRLVRPHITPPKPDRQRKVELSQR